MEDRITLLPIVIYIWIIVVLALFKGLKYVKKKEVIFWQGKPAKKLTLFFGYFLLIAPILASYPTTCDFIFLDYKTNTISVEGINSSKVGPLKYDIRTDKGNYIVLLNKFHFNVGSTYKIKYSSRSRIVLDMNNP